MLKNGFLLMLRRIPTPYRDLTREVKANFAEPEFKRVDDEGAVLDRLSPAAADCPDGTEGAETVSEHVIVSSEYQKSISDENEANLGDNVSGMQKPVAVDVMANSDALPGLDTGVKANVGEAAIERERDEKEVGVGSDVNRERVMEQAAAKSASRQESVVGDGGQNRRGDRTGYATSKKEKKRLRREMTQREMERRRAASQKESEPRCDERLGGVDSIFADVAVVVACGHHSRSP